MTVWFKRWHGVVTWRAPNCFWNRKSLRIKSIDTPVMCGVCKGRCELPNLLHHERERERERRKRGGTEVREEGVGGREKWSEGRERRKWEMGRGEGQRRGTGGERRERGEGRRAGREEGERERETERDMEEAAREIDWGEEREKTGWCGWSDKGRQNEWRKAGVECWLIPCKTIHITYIHTLVHSVRKKHHRELLYSGIRHER